MEKKPTSQKQPGTARERVRKAGRKAEEAAQPEPAAPEAPVQFSPELERFVQFMRSLPLTPEPVEWIETFRVALGKLLGDVDRISVKIETNCDLVAPRTAGMVVDISRMITHEDSKARKRLRWTAIQVDTLSQSGQLLQEMQRGGYNLAAYHPPHCFEYRYLERQHLALLILWRECTRPPISVQSLELIQALEPFMINLFSSFVARYNMAHPEARLFADAFGTAWRASNMTEREAAVLLLQGLGFTYEQIAERLLISEHTVTKRVKSIHRKTGCSTFLELFGRYVMEQEEQAAARQEKEGDGMVLVF